MAPDRVIAFARAAVVRDVEALRPFPTVMQQILPLLQKFAAVSEIEDILKNDPDIAVRVVSMAQSAYYCSDEDVDVRDLRDAVVYLARRHLCEAILIACAAEYVESDLRAYGYTTADQVWQHFVAVAMMSQKLTLRCHLENSLSSFMAGLLHDFGKLVLHKYVAAREEDFVKALGEGCSVEMAEQKILGIDHATVSGIIAEKWALPELVTAAMRDHHSEARKCSRYAMIVRAADGIVNASEFGCLAGVSSTCATTEQLMKQLGGGETIQLLTSEVRAGVNDALKVLRAPTWVNKERRHG